jgi:transcriptional regulator with XRE-family HTH domain
MRIGKGLMTNYVAKALGLGCRQYNRIEKSGLYLTDERIDILSHLLDVTKADLERCVKNG